MTNAKPILRSLFRHVCIRVALQKRSPTRENLRFAKNAHAEMYCIQLLLKMRVVFVTYAIFITVPHVGAFSQDEHCPLRL